MLMAQFKLISSQFDFNSLLKHFKITGLNMQARTHYRIIVV